MACPICGAPVQGRANKRFCSRQCRERSWNEASQISRRGPHKCKGCGEIFVVGYPDKRRDFCSRRCQLRGRNEASQTHRRGPRVCKECGEMFVVGYPDKRRHFCSKICQRRFQARLSDGYRRAQAAGITRIDRFDPVTVLKRDGYRCLICGQATPPELRGTNDPRAPEVDHIVPLSLGGAHTRENSQCLCRGCNCKKAMEERRRAA